MRNEFNKPQFLQSAFFLIQKTLFLKDVYLQI